MHTTSTLTSWQSSCPCVIEEGYSLTNSIPSLLHPPNQIKPESCPLIWQLICFLEFPKRELLLLNLQVNFLAHCFVCYTKDYLFVFLSIYNHEKLTYSLIVIVKHYNTLKTCLACHNKSLNGMTIYVDLLFDYLVASLLQVIVIP